MTKVLVFGSSGTARLFRSGEYDYNPPSPQYLYYQGYITLKPGFHTYPDQEVHIGPNIVVPPGATIEGEDWLETAMFYDKYGRVIQTKAQNHLGENDLISTQYDFSGKVLRTISDHSSEYDDVKVLDRFTYDHTGRLVRTYQTINDAQFELVVTENEYNELGQLIKKNLHYPDEPINNPINVFLQSWDYSYNIRGWLEFVNDHNNFDGSIFSYRLRYDEPWGSTGNEAYYNGNISSVTWGDPDTSPIVTYNAYTYDDLNRLKQSQIYHWYNGGWDDPREEYKVYDIVYDLNGNIKNIKRNKGVDGGSPMDDIEYTYHENAGNRLKKVQDVVTSSWSGIDFSDNGVNLTEEYLYDGNGNMIEDKNKGITVTYNYLNLPETVNWTDGEKIEWMYDANGTKLRKTVFDADGEAMFVNDYANGYVYNTNFSDALPQLSFFTFSEGRVLKTGSTFEYEYHVKDHLGNVRMTFEDNNGTPLVKERNFYYPFGLTVTTGNILGPTICLEQALNAMDISYLY
jgi:hypothetical protein